MSPIIPRAFSCNCVISSMFSASSPFLLVPNFCTKILDNSCSDLIKFKSFIASQSNISGIIFTKKGYRSLVK
nr:MAG TPA: hypothetical protein [Caudoviricetes sp.]